MLHHTQILVKAYVTNKQLRPIPLEREEEDFSCSSQKTLALQIFADVLYVRRPHSNKWQQLTIGMSSVTAYFDQESKQLIDYNALVSPPLKFLLTHYEVNSLYLHYFFMLLLSIIHL